MKRIIALTLLLALLASCLTGCSLLRKSESEPASAPSGDTVEKLVDRCESACNEVDVSAILDCIKPSIADPLRSMVKLAGSLGGVSDEEMLSTLVELMEVKNSGDPLKLCKTLKLQTESVSDNGDEATAHVSFSFFQDEQEYEGKADVECVRIDGQWYVAKLNE